jgi:chorismate mutase/prephenate dehydratase
VSDGKRETDELRQEMARLDAQLLAALDKRARAARRLGETRTESTPSLPLGDHASLRELMARSSGDMPPDSMREIFRTIYAACLSLETQARVVFVGPEGGPGHAAAAGRFGPSGTFVAADGTPAALEEVLRKRAHFAVVPFETSAEGPVQSTLLALMTSDVRIAEVLDLAQELHLMNRTGNFADVEKIYATPADHAASQKTLTGQAPRVQVLDVKTPMMACQLAVEDHGAAALVSEAFGARHGLAVAQRNMLDDGGQRVRYAVVAARPSSRTGNDVTALVFGVQDAPGSLLDVLKVFAERGINLTKIQSHPMTGEGWKYMFLLEAVGHFTDRPLVMAFEEMKRITRFFKVLGSYPAP